MPRKGVGRGRDGPEAEQRGEAEWEGAGRLAPLTRRLWGLEPRDVLGLKPLPGVRNALGTVLSCHPVIPIA